METSGVTDKPAPRFFRYRRNLTWQRFKTPWSGVLAEKLTGPDVVKKFPTFYGTRRFITALITARHLSISWARSIQYIPPSHFSKIHFNIILPSSSGWPRDPCSIVGKVKNVFYSSQRLQCLTIPTKSIVITAYGSFPGSKAAGTWSLPLTSSNTLRRAHFFF